MTLPQIIIPKFTAVELKIRREECPSEWKLVLTAWYEKAVLEGYDRVTGFYVLRPEICQIKLRGKRSSREVTIRAKLDKIWHTGSSGTIDIVAKLDREDIWEIDRIIQGQDLDVIWSASGYGFPEETVAKELGIQFVRILCSSREYHTISREEFVRNVLEPVDRFRREYLEVVLPTPDLLNRTPHDLRPLADLIQKQSFLVEALRRLSSARTSSEYRDVIKSVRDAIDRAENLLRGIQENMVNKLYIELGTFRGEGAEATARMEVDSIIRIFDRLFSMASGFSHTQTHDNRPYEPYPEYTDAYYLTLMTIVALNFLAEKLRAYNERRT